MSTDKPESETRSLTCKNSGVAPCYVPAGDMFYLSFGGGVNSTALYLFLLEQGQEFEAVYVDHGTDYPETTEYVEYFANRHPVTIIKATVTRKGKRYHSLHEFCELRGLIPQQYPRWCTGDWKRNQIYKYVKKPCWMAIGIDAGESRRVRASNISKVEFVHPLVDADIDRQGCKELIARHGLKVPPKSGCWICPFQRPDQWKALRRNHPDLFCRAERMETASRRTFDRRGRSLKQIINERQNFITADMDYPPCNCGL